MPSWIAITNLGSSALLLPFAVAIAACLAAGRAWRLAGLWLALFSAGVLLVVVTKVLFLGWGIGARSINFTGISGHAMLATAVLPATAYLILHRRSRRVRLAGAAAAGLIGLAVAVSRVTLNAHSVSEVAAGLALGLAVSTAFVALSRRYEPPRLSGRVLLLVFALLFGTLYGQRLPTQRWIRDVAVTLAGRDRPFIREVWHRTGPAPGNAINMKSTCQPFLPHCRFLP